MSATVASRPAKHARSEELIEAINEHDRKTVLALLEAGVPADVESESGYSALDAAVGESDIATVRLLLKHGADPNLLPSSEIPALWSAVSSATTHAGRREDRHSIALAIIDELLKHGASLSLRSPGGPPVAAARVLPVLQHLYDHAQRIAERDGTTWQKVLGLTTKNQAQQIQDTIEGGPKSLRRPPRLSP